MTRQKWTYLLMALALIAGTAVALNRMRTNQKLGPPGVKTAAIPGSRRLEIYLPPKVLDYDSVVVPTDTNVLNGLPHDTSFAQRRYQAPGGEWLLFNVVLMGSDRTSIHKPEFCLTGSGWSINDDNSFTDRIRLEHPQPYDLPVRKLISSREATIDGQKINVSGIYVYWFVADHQLTEGHWARMYRTSKHLLATGELQRWAYVSCFAVCLPGEESRTYDRMKKFIAASVPEFQLAAGEPAAAPLLSQAALR